MENILELKNVTKEYPGVRALDNVNFNVTKGEIHAICGENGAGKSTLIKSISGAVSLTSGRIIFDGAGLEVNKPKDSIDKGISVIYQEFNLFPNLTVYENIFFGIEFIKNGKLDRKKMKDESEKILKKLGVNLDVNLKIKDVTVAYQQIVEIAKSVVRDAKLIIMDEPSAALAEQEVDVMLSLTKKLNENGVTFIYISHKLDEVMELSDRISILRDGKYIDTINTSETNTDEIIKLMVGRDIEDIYPEKNSVNDDVKLSVNNITGGIIKDISFKLYEGEVLGFGGLVGSGRTELMRLIFGADQKETGRITIDNQKVVIKNPLDAINNRIGLIPEDRKNHGLVLNKSIFFNEVLPNLGFYSKNVLSRLNQKESKKDLEIVNKNLNVKLVNINQITSSLSGGNQQKIVLAKWLLNNCDILILDEPTRGIDVGAKQEIYQLITSLTTEGKSIIVVSSEMPELIGLSNRILVMNEGQISGELKGEDMTQENILELASIDMKSGAL